VLRATVSAGAIGFCALETGAGAGFVGARLPEAQPTAVPSKVVRVKQTLAQLRDFMVIAQIPTPLGRRMFQTGEPLRGSAETAKGEANTEVQGVYIDATARHGQTAGFSAT
jgi:hypothetical protein